MKCHLQPLGGRDPQLAAGIPFFSLGTEHCLKERGNEVRQKTGIKFPFILEGLLGERGEEESKMCCISSVDCAELKLVYS